jgi:hypothetical protein
MRENARSFAGRTAWKSVGKFVVVDGERRLGFGGNFSGLPYMETFCVPHGGVWSSYFLAVSVTIMKLFSNPLKE